MQLNGVEICVNQVNEVPVAADTYTLTDVPNGSTWSLVSEDGARVAVCNPADGVLNFLTQMGQAVVAPKPGETWTLMETSSEAPFLWEEIRFVAPALTQECAADADPSPSSDTLQPASPPTEEASGGSFLEGMYVVLTWCWRKFRQVFLGKFAGFVMGVLLVLSLLGGCIYGLYILIENALSPPPAEEESNANTTTKAPSAPTPEKNVPKPPAAPKPDTQKPTSPTWYEGRAGWMRGTCLPTVYQDGKKSFFACTTPNATACRLNLPRTALGGAFYLAPCPPGVRTQITSPKK